MSRAGKGPMSEPRISRIVSLSERQKPGTSGQRCTTLLLCISESENNDVHSATAGVWEARNDGGFSARGYPQSSGCAAAFEPPLPDVDSKCGETPHSRCCFIRRNRGCLSIPSWHISHGKVDSGTAFVVHGSVNSVGQGQDSNEHRRSLRRFGRVTPAAGAVPLGITLQSSDSRSSREIDLEVRNAVHS